MFENEELTAGQKTAQAKPNPLAVSGQRATFEDLTGEVPSISGRWGVGALMVSPGLKDTLPPGERVFDATAALEGRETLLAEESLQLSLVQLFQGVDSN